MAERPRRSRKTDSAAEEVKTDHSQQEPDVTVFGERISQRYWDERHHGAGGSVWGVFFIIAGIILIGNALGAIPWEFWNHVWQFWPILLILWGINIILGNNPFSRLVLFILSIIAFGLIAAYGLKAVGSSFANNYPKPVNDFVNWVTSQRKY